MYGYSRLATTSVLEIASALCVYSKRSRRSILKSFTNLSNLLVENNDSFERESCRFYYIVKMFKKCAEELIDLVNLHIYMQVCVYTLMCFVSPAYNFLIYGL